MIAADLAAEIAGWQDFLRDEKRASRHTIRAYRGDVEGFVEFLRGHLARPPASADLNELAIADYRGWLSRRAAEGAGAATRARALSGLRHFMRWRQQQGAPASEALEQLRGPKQQKPLPRPLTVGDAMQLLETAPDLQREDWQGARDLALFTLLYAAGLRIDEALSLNQVDWRPAEGAITVRGKGNKQRRVPLLPVAIDAVAAYRAACPFASDSADPLFVGARGGRLNPSSAQRQMRKLRAFLQLPDSVTPHALRHSFASHLLGSGVDLRAIQELLGHASLASTQRYADIETEQLIEIYNRAHPRA